MEMADAAVIREILGGNINKFELFVDKYSSKIESFVSSRLFDKEGVDDIVQNSFIQLYKAIPRLDKKLPIYPYLLKIARNELYMYFRKRHVTVSLDEATIQIPETEKGMTGDITEITEGLKSENKKALLLFAEGYSYQEIAKRLNKPLNTIRTLIHRARLHIQKKYKNEIR